MKVVSKVVAGSEGRLRSSLLLWKGSVSSDNLEAEWKLEQVFLSSLSPLIHFFF